MSEDEERMVTDDCEARQMVDNNTTPTSAGHEPKAVDLSTTDGRVQALFQCVTCLRRLLPPQSGHLDPALRLGVFDETKDIWEDWRNKFILTSIYNDWIDAQAKEELAARLTGPIGTMLLLRSDATIHDVMERMNARFLPPDDPPATSQRPLELLVKSQDASLDDSAHDATMTYNHILDDDNDLDSTREYDDEERASGRFSESSELQGPMPQCGSPLAPGSQ